MLDPAASFGSQRIQIRNANFLSMKINVGQLLLPVSEIAKEALHFPWGTAGIPALCPGSCPVYCHISQI